MKPIFYLIVLFIVTTSAAAQDVYTVKSVKASVLGTSTLHDWDSDITRIECTARFKTDKGQLQRIENIKAKVEVTGIKSHEGKLMDSKTYEAFKYEQNPTIIFEASDAEVNITNGTAIIKANGNLTMAGVTKAIVLEATGKTLAGGDIQIDVSKALNMTEYEMQPPTAVLGTIKVGPVVTVKVSLTLTRTPASSLSSN